MDNLLIKLFAAYDCTADPLFEEAIDALYNSNIVIKEADEELGTLGYNRTTKMSEWFNKYG